MKPSQINIIKTRLYLQGYDNEVPLSILKRELSEYVGLDKYRLKYTIDTLVELGFFEWSGIHSLKINDNNNKSDDK